MRVIAGKYRGRVLASFQGDAVRPTPDRVKESLFQILSPKILCARVLDLFSGSGALGIECLSRGASEAVFNDCSKDSIAILKKNLALVKEQATVTNCDFRACLARMEGAFDLIFCDPPYKENYLADICASVKARKLLKENGLIIYESEREELTPGGFELSDRRRYGRTIVSMYRACKEE